ncbi:uncharacterized protein LOC143482555 [Brachyhypopomus gauderio]|uniref:uncharacterized protein LOC143482555 n=1 Tax=Brachyhypopomus gauderio TaxID=698409 RepID=UPI004041D124
MADDPNFAYTGGSTESTVADVTDCFDSEQNKKVHQSSSDGEGTIVLDVTLFNSDEDTSVPELRRTDSVILNRQMLGYTTDEYPSSEDSEEEYVPQSDEDIESDSLEHDSAAEGDCSSGDKQHKGKKRKAQTTNSHERDNQQCKRRHMTDSSSQVGNVTGESSSTSSTDVTVMTLKKKEHGGRLYNKKFYCVFCAKPFSKIARHLECKHKDKPEVARAITFPKSSKERRIHFSLLRNRGNRIHNNQVLKEGKGMVIPQQQSSVPVKASDYLHCVNCEAYLKRRTLWKHMQRCHLNKKVKKTGKTRVQALCAYAQPVPDTVSAKFWKIVLDMHEDAVTNVVRTEKVILKFGEHLFNKHGHDVTKHEYIRQKMRETGRLVLQGKKNGKLKIMNDFFVPCNFPHVIETVKTVAGLNEDTNTYKTPSLALKLGHNLKKIANIIECEAMMSGDEKVIHNVQVFKQLCETKWSECVSSQALRNLSEAKWNAPQLLPFAEDVKKMHQYLNIQRKQWQNALEKEPNKKNWAELAKITLCEVILFNRRREGEVSKMSLNAFTLRDTSATHPDVEHALSDLEKKLCKHFQRVEIKGKRGRKVPLLLTPDMLASMELLVKCRRKCDVPDENQFMFGRPQALSHFRGSDVIRLIAQSCGAKHPEALSSTKLRKHMATMSKVLNLKDNEMDDLADFLGHDIRVHRQYYRLPEGTLQLAKISKVLMALERGQLSQFKGRNLDEISIDPEEKMTVDSDASDTDEDVRAVKDAESESSPSLSDHQEMMRTSKPTTEAAQVCIQPKTSLHPAKGSSKTQKRKWTDEEIKAVEKTLLEFISMGKVPGKSQCLHCIETSPTALKSRSWEAIKYYVKNRIDASKRHSK